MDNTELPDFNTRIHWKNNKDRKVRKELNFDNTKGGLPSLEKHLNKSNPLIRQHSTSSRGENPKKYRTEDMDQSQPETDDECL